MRSKSYSSGICTKCSLELFLLPLEGGLEGVTACGTARAYSGMLFNGTVSEVAV